ncbi:hypothetical protein [Streptomyces griseosporeus]|uniref:LppU/SCO3897 family protein n=1 Tax=Streptomyces griseosporeus TaxID=1910 RepID=UPI0037029BF3
MTTPPTQGQNPYGQTPPPPAGYGQPGVPPQGAPAPYAPFPNQGAPMGGAPVPPAPPARRGGKKVFKVLAGIVVAVIVALLKFGGIFGITWFASRDDAETTSVGSCMHNKGNDSDPDLEEVDCSAGNAQYKVVEKFNFTSDSSKCETVKDATISYYQSGGGHSVVLCLKEVK